VFSFSFLRQIPSSFKGFFVESQRKYHDRYKLGRVAGDTRVGNENLAKPNGSDLVTQKKQLVLNRKSKDPVALLVSLTKAMRKFLKPKEVTSVVPAYPNSYYLQSFLKQQNIDADFFRGRNVYNPFFTLLKRELANFVDNRELTNEDFAKQNIEGRSYDQIKEWLRNSLYFGVFQPELLERLDYSSEFYKKNLAKTITAMLDIISESYLDNFDALELQERIINCAMVLQEAIKVQNQTLVPERKFLNQIDYFNDEVNAEEKSLIKFLGPKNPSSKLVQTRSNDFNIIAEAFEDLKGKNYFADLDDVNQFATRIFTLFTLQKKPQDFKFDFVNSFDSLTINEVESFINDFIADPSSYMPIEAKIEDHAFCIFNIIKEALIHDDYGNITNIDPSRLNDYLYSMRSIQA
jgi:hypothetical protein